MTQINRLFIILCLLCFASSHALAQGTTSYPASLDTGATLPQAVDQKFTFLTVATTNSATTITVNSTAAVPANGVLQIDSELMSYATATGTTFTVARAFSGTVAVAHLINATVRFPIVAAHIDGPRGAVFALEAKLGVGSSNASGATTGYVLTKQADGSTAWATAAGGGSGTVTSVALSLPGIFSVSGSPVTTTGTLTGALAVQNANKVFSGPTTGADAAPAFRALVEADVPTLAQSKITNLTTDLAGKQPLDSDLTAIAAVAPANDDILQRKSGAWINRTMAQLKTDLALVKGDVGLGNVDNTSDATKNSATATLTNKSVALGSNTITGTTAQFNTALTDNDFATLAGSESLSNKVIITPTIASFTNATHTHQNAAGGGALDVAAITSGAFAKARQHSATVYNDQANSFTSGFAQSFFAGSNFELKDPTTATKKVQFDVSNVAASTTRTVNIPNANSTTVQTVNCTNQFLNAISAQGVGTCASAPSATSGESLLASDYNIVTAGVWEDTGLSISLPSAGTYDIRANIRIGIGTNGIGGWIVTKLVNSTDGADVANSNLMIFYTEDSLPHANSMGVSFVVTVAATKTIKLYAQKPISGQPTRRRACAPTPTAIRNSSTCGSIKPYQFWKGQ